MEIRLFAGSIKTRAAEYDDLLAKVGAAAGRLRDTSCNGPEGGIDKERSIVMTVPGLATLRVEEQAADSYEAIDVDAGTLKKSLARSLESAKANGPRYCVGPEAPREVPLRVVPCSARRKHAR